MTSSTRRVTRYFTHARAAIAAVAVSGTLLGCGGGDKATGPGGGIAGKYNIVSTNGPAGPDNSAPFVIILETVGGSTYRGEIASGSITLGTDGRYTGTGAVNVYVDDVLMFSEDNFPSGGKYAVSGSIVTFTPDDTSEDPVAATFSGGNTLTFSQTDPDFGTITVVAKK